MDQGKGATLNSAKKFKNGDKLRCINANHTGGTLVHDFDYKVIDVHPETGGVLLQGDTPCYWHADRFVRSTGR